MGVRARVSRCSPRFINAPHVQRAAHLEFEWLRAPLVGSIWLLKLSELTLAPTVALDPTSEAGLKKHLGKMHALIDELA